jgi:hypothetical protein
MKYSYVKEGEEMLKKRISGAKTPLERYVQGWLNKRAPDYENGAEGVLKDLFSGGFKSSMVTNLTYYRDTLLFFKKHLHEINALLANLMDLTGETPHELFPDWQMEDPLALDTSNQNLLAWFGFEETARNLANMNGIEVEARPSLRRPKPESLT